MMILLIYFAVKLNMNFSNKDNMFSNEMKLVQSFLLLLMEWYQFK